MAKETATITIVEQERDPRYMYVTRPVYTEVEELPDGWQLRQDGKYQAVFGTHTAVELDRQGKLVRTLPEGAVTIG